MGGDDYPKLTPIAVKIRDMEQDISRDILGRGDFAHFEDDEITKTAQFFWDFGLTSTIDLQTTRTPNRTFIPEDLRRGGDTAKSLRLFTALLNLSPPPLQDQQGKRGEFCRTLHSPLTSGFARSVSGFEQLAGPWPTDGRRGPPSDF